MLDADQEMHTVKIYQRACIGKKREQSKSKNMSLLEKAKKKNQNQFKKKIVKINVTKVCLMKSSIPLINSIMIKKKITNIKNESQRIATDIRYIKIIIREDYKQP